MTHYNHSENDYKELKHQTMVEAMLTKDLDYYLGLPYPIELIPDVDGFWFARIPLLSGCMTNGSNPQEALALLDDAKQLWLSVAVEKGFEIPEPSKITTVL